MRDGWNFLHIGRRGGGYESPEMISNLARLIAAIAFRCGRQQTDSSSGTR